MFIYVRVRRESPLHRPFTIGRANWHIIDTIHGAQASAVIYSLVETAKANKLKIYEYLKHLLTEIPKHMDNTSLDVNATLILDHCDTEKVYH